MEEGGPYRTASKSEQWETFNAGNVEQLRQKIDAWLAERLDKIDITGKSLVICAYDSNWNYVVVRTIYYREKG